MATGGGELPRTRERSRSRAPALSPKLGIGCLGLLLLTGLGAGWATHPGGAETTPLGTLGSTGQPLSPAHSAGANMVPAATTDTLYVDGYSPTAIAVHWDTSHDVCFDHYEIDRSTNSSGGPWVPVWNTSDVSRYEFMMTGLSPGAHTWWRDVDYSGCGGGQAGSNVLAITNPGAAQLTYADSSPTSILLAWTNGAHYYGLLAFVSYTVSKAVNGGPYRTIASIASAATTTYTDTGLTGLDSGARYQYLIATNENCSGTYCAGLNGTTTSLSNRVTQLALAPPVASPASLRVNESTSVQVPVIGGTPPYTYSWAGLPTGCPSSSVNPLWCWPKAPGSFSVIVSVSDSRGISITSRPVTLTVTEWANASGNGSGTRASSSPVNPYLVALPIAAALVGMILLVLFRRRRKPTTMPSLAFAPGSTPEAPEPPELARQPWDGQYR